MGSHPLYTDVPLAVIHTPRYETSKTDPFTVEASKMALSHNAFIRGFNSIYQQAPRLLPGDKSDFVGYCIAWHDCVEAHHRYEEDHFFPNVNKAAGLTGLMDSAVHEHASFHDGMERFKSYLRTEGVGFSATELLAIMDSFKEPLHSHLRAEPPLIAALAKYSTHDNPIDILEIANAAARKQITMSLVLNVLPVFYLNMNEAEFEGGMWQGVFPHLNGTGTWIVTKAVPMWHSRRWRFASCSSEGRLKQLAV
ncbi:Uu.00g133630.m01.CDS01 [Anthostomella pinea]|uniref:Uu.00g133630.m01.CDS01 n=1 Tax=Anthostomella pinea TaxID=933095 RepID=A0AAI8VPH7_9PEZI|nr:Uu.00g133630.m01.CDS01 [Anthostomella pinea]